MSARPAPDALPGLSVLEQTPIVIEKLVHLISEEQASWKPAPDRWSVREVLAHLADVEIYGFRNRIEKMVGEDNPSLESYDQNAAYAAGKYSSGSSREHLKDFCHERDRSLSMLRYAPADVAMRKGRHAHLGSITVAQVLNEGAFHDLGHIRQISELFRSRAFYPFMGPFQSYYEVKP